MSPPPPRLVITQRQILILALLLRFAFFLYGLYQDAHMNVKYTDIDYKVFSDAAEYVYNEKSPYSRLTYRYTPLLSWMLMPTALGGYAEHYGKFVFMLCDILTGVLILRTLERILPKTNSTSFYARNRDWILSSIWLLNPMVITISTRGSAESVLTCIVMLFVDTLLQGLYFPLAFWLGLAIHFKLYPIIYLPAVLLYLVPHGKPFINVPVLRWLNPVNLKYLFFVLMSLGVCTYVMYQFYSYEFVYHSYLYHLTRLDHRHNFSVYNTMLYLKSAAKSITDTGFSFVPSKGTFEFFINNIEKVAFVPQLGISGILVPLLLARQNITACFFIQTFVFVTFNKVITSQYFIWFLIFLPHYLGTSALLQKSKVRGAVMLVLWILTQSAWLSFAYQLEFLAENTFGELLFSSVFFFLTNCYIIGVFIELA